MLKLSQLPVYARGRIIYINAEGMVRRRLMDLGFVPGTEVEVVRGVPGRGLAVFLIRGTMIALRKAQSDQIFVDIEPEQGC